MVTVDPAATVVPLCGVCEMTSPSDALVVSWFWTLTWRPAPSMRDTAVSLSWPTTPGTDTSWGPLETISVTVVPRSTWVPADGRVSMTWPFATLCDGWSRVVAFSPSALSASLASLTDLSTTSGTATWPGPPDTTSVTVEPSSTFFPG